jgi:HprK-related kinase A
MSLLSSLSSDRLYRQLSEEGVTIGIGPFWINARSTITSLVDHLTLMYGAYPVSDQPFADFHVCLDHASGLRRWIRPQVNFFADIEKPFKPLPLNQTSAFFEWGLNWCVSTMAHQYLIIHAAVVAKGEHAVLLPGSPGAGKSTLCAALVHQGWRLLSDEMALIDPQTCLVSPIPRPISIKNASIDVIRAFAPEAVFGPVVHDTHKGTVTHVKAPHLNSEEKALIRWVVFPEYHAGCKQEIVRTSQARIFMDLVAQSFNYGALGLTAFKTVEKIVNESEDRYVFRYSDLDQAIKWFNSLPLGI